MGKEEREIKVSGQADSHTCACLHCLVPALGAGSESTSLSQVCWRDSCIWGHGNASLGTCAGLGAMEAAWEGGVGLGVMLPMDQPGPGV